MSLIAAHPSTESVMVTDRNAASAVYVMTQLLENFPNQNFAGSVV